MSEGSGPISGAVAETGRTAMATAAAAAADEQHDMGVAAAAAELGLDASLFKVVTGSSTGGAWEQVAPSVLPRFCNARERSGGPPEWHLNVEGSQVRRAGRPAPASLP